MLKNFNFDYNPENDSLFLYDPSSKSKASIEMADFIIDFNAQKQISGIELLNASEFLERLEIEEGQVNVKDLLRSIKECKMDIVEKGNFFVIKFILISVSKGRLATPLLVPTINESSPALAGIAC